MGEVCAAAHWLAGPGLLQALLALAPPLVGRLLGSRAPGAELQEDVIENSSMVVVVWLERSRGRRCFSSPGEFIMGIRGRRGFMPLAVPGSLQPPTTNRRLTTPAQLAAAGSRAGKQALGACATAPLGCMVDRT